MEKFKEALADYDKALKLDPKNPRKSFTTGGWPASAWEQAAQALEDFNQTLVLDPKFARAQYNRGRALEQLGRLPEARGAYRTFLQEATPSQDKPLLERTLERLKQMKEKEG